ncbi:MAG: ABC transporter ATP-binding protein [Clostridiales bacterium]|jgi:ABC-2 type transport system ATP-binding protein|nr:ABC transporter ATP-binding protein [Clostridiales bacterium]
MELSLDRLTKHFAPKIAVDCISAKLSPGVYGLLGANGAGKTTLMRMLCGILEPSSGEVLFDGRNIMGMGSRYRNILGYLPQDFGCYPDYTAREFLMYIAALKGLPRRAAIKRSEELLNIVDLDACGKKIRTFSGGMRQRLGIAQALLNNPGVLVLDEPTAGLDPKERVRFRNLIADYAGDKIVILSTHIVSDIEAIADEVFLMKKGRFLLQGAIPELVQRISGKVWELTVSEQEARKWEETVTVSNLRHSNEQVILRIISEEQPSLNAVPCEAALEDLYLYHFPTAEGAE